MRKEAKIEGLNIHNLEIEIMGDVTQDQLNIGNLYLESTDGKRDAIFDTASTFIDDMEFTGHEYSRVQMDLFIDTEASESRHNLEMNDLLDGNHDSIKARLWLEEQDFEIKRILLHFDHEGQDYQLECEIY